MKLSVATALGLLTALASAATSACHCKVTDVACQQKCTNSPEYLECAKGCDMGSSDFVNCGQRCIYGEVVTNISVPGVSTPALPTATAPGNPAEESNVSTTDASATSTSLASNTSAASQSSASSVFSASSQSSASSASSHSSAASASASSSSAAPISSSSSTASASSTTTARPNGAVGLSSGGSLAGVAGLAVALLAL